YLPLLGPNSMGTRKEHLKELEPTDQPTWDMPLTVQLKTVALGWYRVTRIMDATFAQLSAGGSPLAVSGNELESLRKMIFEVNPTLLLITIVAACLHMLFETLAVKSDIDHWSRKKSITGISRSSVFMGALTSWLTLLYVWDRRKDSGMLVLTGTAVSAVVELWKVFKVRRFLRQPAVANEDVSKVSNEKKMNDPVSVDQAIPTTDTASLEDFDNRVVKYLLYLCIPLIIGYAGYSLVFWKHKGFYSWGLDALMASIYLLGFVNMTPQLFLNHRLQSVEAMSLATFIYRAINTFVDDLFALVIPMPGLTRVSAFRDDIIFVVLLYQWWKF
ncbi:cleft lip and palate transmembrane protein 1-domain-containing protein, partial [Dimargaris cristalligena]